MERKKSIFKKRYMSALVLLLLVIGIGAGYAALQTTLKINGNTTIGAVTWDVHFENAQKTSNSTVEGTVTIENGDDGKASTKATYTTTLAKPGDKYEFTIDVVNKGSIDAKLKSQSFGTLTTDENKLLVYTVDGVPENGTVLTKKVDASTFGHYTITVTVEYNPAITAEQLPEDDVLIQKTIELVYVQDGVNS